MSAAYLAERARRADNLERQLRDLAAEWKRRSKRGPLNTAARTISGAANELRAILDGRHPVTVGSLTMDDVDDLLAAAYTGDGIELWWNARNTELAGQRPIDLWREGGESRELVIAQAQRLNGYAAG